MIAVFLLIIFVFILYCRPYIDYFKDYRNKTHLLIWYFNFKGERKYIDLIGSQE